MPVYDLPVTTTHTDQHSQLTITHDYADGSLLHGTTRADTRPGEPMRDVLNTYQWRWSRQLGCWFQQSSRDRPAKRWRLERTADALRELGIPVDVTIDDTLRDMAEREHDRQERAADRADALDAKADRRATQAAHKQHQGDRVFQNIPMGQPLMPGHHSYPADRNRREKAHRDVMQAYDLRQDSTRAQSRADTARQSTDRRYAPRTVLRRIERLDSALRDVQRDLAGREQWMTENDGTQVWRPAVPGPEWRAELEQRQHDLEQQVEWWRAVHQRQVADGAVTMHGPDDITKGQEVLVSGTWRRVVRVNKKTVTVVQFTGPTGSEITGTVPYREITRVRDAEE